MASPECAGRYYTRTALALAGKLSGSVGPVNAATIAIFGYVLLQLGIGYVVSRGVRSETDYLLAGRKLGPLLAFFSVFATWFGAESCIGSAGEAYSSGISAVRADPFGYAGCLFLMGLLLAAPLWRRGLTTLGDLFRSRFGPRAERLAVIVMVPSSVMWAGAQIRAFGQVLSASAGLDVTLMITIAAAIVITYTAVGGMMADAVTDLVQGSVLVLGLVLLLVMALSSGDLSALSSVSAEHLAFTTPEESFFDIAEGWAVPLLGSLVAVKPATGRSSGESATTARAVSFTLAHSAAAIGLASAAANSTPCASSCPA
jgi:Na+/proline symporter